MTDFKITPSLKLMQQWAHDADPSVDAYYDLTADLEYEQFIATRAAQWGSDQELEACCEWLIAWDTCEGEKIASLLREGRRTKPPSLKEQALDVLKDLSNGIETADSWHVIQSALEQLDD